MTKQSSGGTAVWLSIAVAVTAGVAVELGMGGSRREAWDSPSYWSVGVPAMMLAALVCGFVARRKPGLIGYAPFFGQLLAMFAKTGAGSMLPLGAILLGVIGFSGVAAAFGGALLGRRALG